MSDTMKSNGGLCSLIWSFCAVSGKRACVYSVLCAFRKSESVCGTQPTRTHLLRKNKRLWIGHTPEIGHFFFFFFTSGRSNYSSLHVKHFKSRLENNLAGKWELLIRYCVCFCLKGGSKITLFDVLMLCNICTHADKDAFGWFTPKLYFEN